MAIDKELFDASHELIYPVDALHGVVARPYTNDYIVKEKMYTKDEVIAMLTEIKDEANNINPTIYNCSSFIEGIREFGKLIQQKIDKLKGEQDG